MKRNVYLFLLKLLSPLRGLGLRKFSLVRSALSLMKPRVLIVHGHPMYLNTADSSFYEPLHAGLYEPFETELIVSTVEEGDRVIDIGANIGYYTLLLARKVGTSGEVFAFEPEPVNLKLLEKNLVYNRYKNVTASPIGLSDHAGEAVLYVNSYNKGDNRIFSSDGFDSVSITLNTLDAQIPLELHGSIDFIKMDIQGAECLVLRGMEDILSKSKNLRLALEFWPRKLRRAGTSAEELLDILERHGFDCSVIDEEKRQLIPATRRELLARFPEAEDAATNLFCTRQ